MIGRYNLVIVFPSQIYQPKKTDVGEDDDDDYEDDHTSNDDVQAACDTSLENLCRTLACDQPLAQQTAAQRATSTSSVIMMSVCLK